MYKVLFILLIATSFLCLKVSGQISYSQYSNKFLSDTTDYHAAYQDAMHFFKEVINEDRITILQRTDSIARDVDQKILDKKIRKASKLIQKHGIPKIFGSTMTLQEMSGTTHSFHINLVKVNGGKELAYSLIYSGSGDGKPQYISIRYQLLTNVGRKKITANDFKLKQIRLLDLVIDNKYGKKSDNNIHPLLAKLEVKPIKPYDFMGFWDLSKREKLTVSETYEVTQITPMEFDKYNPPFAFILNHPVKGTQVTKISDRDIRDTKFDYFMDGNKLVLKTNKGRVTYLVQSLNAKEMVLISEPRYKGKGGYYRMYFNKNRDMLPNFSEQDFRKIRAIIEGREMPKQVIAADLIRKRRSKYYYKLPETNFILLPYSGDVIEKYGDFIIKKFKLVNGIMQGKFVEYSARSKHKIKEGQYVDGKKEGEWKCWSIRTGTITKIEYFEKDEFHGKKKIWNNEGELTQEINYTRGQFDGPFIIYGKNNQKKEAGNYALGKKHGPWKYYNEAGELFKTVQYEYDNIVSQKLQSDSDGLTRVVVESLKKIHGRHCNEDKPYTGLAIKYNKQKSRFGGNDDDSSYEEFTFKDGLYHGLYRKIENDNVIRKGNYANGKLIGEMKSWHKNGKDYATYSYQNGKLNGTYISYYDNGKLAAKGSYKDNRYDGKLEIYYKSGALSMVSYYGSGININDQIHYDETGWLKYKTTFWEEDGQNWSKKVVYNKNGVVISESQFVDGSKTGLWKEYFDNGQIKMESNYENHYKHGIETKYGESGEIIRKIQYRNRKVVQSWNPQTETPKISVDRAAEVSEKELKRGRYGGMVRLNNLPYTGKTIDRDKSGAIIKEYGYKEGIKHGSGFIRHPNGNMYQKFTFKDGYYEGLFEEFHDNGAIKMRTWYKDKQLSGLKEQYYANGQMANKANFEGHRKYGHVQAWSENGLLTRDLHVAGSEAYIIDNSTIWYDNGNKLKEFVFEKDNLAISYWRENGQLVSIIYYEDGFRSGEGVSYFSNDKKSNINNYALGLPHGFTRNWYENGTLSNEIPYLWGSEHGTVKEFYKNGAKKREGQYYQGWPISHTMWSQTGKIIFRESSDPAQYLISRESWNAGGKLLKKETLWFDQPHGTCEYYDINKKVKEVINYKYGAKHGLYQRFYPNGKIEFKRYYRADKMHGPYQNWLNDGTKKSKGHYKNGEKSGKWISWFKNGKKSWVYDYDKEGAWIEWYDSGKKRTHGNYANNRREGEWSRWYQDGQLREKGSYKGGEKYGRWTTWKSDGTIRREKTHTPIQRRDYVRKKDTLKIQTPAYTFFIPDYPNGKYMSDKVNTKDKQWIINDFATLQTPNHLYHFKTTGATIHTVKQRFKFNVRLHNDREYVLDGWKDTVSQWFTLDTIMHNVYAPLSTGDKYVGKVLQKCYVVNYSSEEMIRALRGKNKSDLVDAYIIKKKIGSNPRRSLTACEIEISGIDQKGLFFTHLIMFDRTQREFH